MTTYTRNDVDYATWYNAWMKMLAKNHTLAELEAKLNGNRVRVGKETASHLNAVNATSSMSSQSARRAHARNIVAATGEEAIAIRGAIEIYELFPEYTQATDSKSAG